MEYTKLIYDKFMRIMNVYGRELQIHDGWDSAIVFCNVCGVSFDYSLDLFQVQISGEYKMNGYTRIRHFALSVDEAFRLASEEDVKVKCYADGCWYYITYKLV